jgi:hypothetical protein
MEEGVTAAVHGNGVGHLGVALAAAAGAQPNLDLVTYVGYQLAEQGIDFMMPAFGGGTNLGTALQQMIALLAGQGITLEFVVEEANPAGDDRVHEVEEEGEDEGDEGEDGDFVIVEGEVTAAAAATIQAMIEAPQVPQPPQEAPNGDDDDYVLVEREDDVAAAEGGDGNGNGEANLARGVQPARDATNAGNDTEANLARRFHQYEGDEGRATGTDGNSTQQTEEFASATAAAGCVHPAPASE